MTKKLQRRIAEVDAVFDSAPVSVERLHPELRNLIQDLCATFAIRAGTLVRRAKAICLIDGVSRISKEQLQEAAQHLIVRN